jgi:5-methylcytosine-specific restriction endonuclease McrA
MGLHAIMNSDVLVLNSGFIPVRVSNLREALCLVMSGRAVPVLEEDRYVRSPSITVRIPSVISLIGYSSFPKKKVAFSKLNVIYRDDMMCQYCGKRYTVRDLTVDHVVPRSRWESVTGRSLKDGFNDWRNLVCACRWCNGHKGNRLLDELDWRLPREPYEPEYMPHIVISLDKARTRGWLPFCTFNVRLIQMIP